jgi:hypothetical protein
MRYFFLDGDNDFDHFENVAALDFLNGQLGLRRQAVVQENLSKNLGQSVIEFGFLHVVSDPCESSVAMKAKRPSMAPAFYFTVE